MAILLMHDGTSRNVEPADPGGFTCQELYALIGNGCEYVEVITLHDGHIMVLDEDGKRRPGATERFNSRATDLLYRAGGMLGDWVTGNAVVCYRKELQ